MGNLGWGRVVAITAERPTLERMKEDLMAVVSHDLKTRVTAIRRSLGLIASGAVGKSDPRIVQPITLAQYNAERHMLLVNGIAGMQQPKTEPLRFTIGSHAMRP